jgi:hypothetical protein
VAPIQSRQGDEHAFSRETPRTQTAVDALGIAEEIELRKLVPSWESVPNHWFFSLISLIGRAGFIIGLLLINKRERRCRPAGAWKKPPESNQRLALGNASLFCLTHEVIAAAKIYEQNVGLWLSFGSPTTNECSCALVRA